MTRTDFISGAQLNNYESSLKYIAFNGIMRRRTHINTIFHLNVQTSRHLYIFPYPTSRRSQKFSRLLKNKPTKRITKRPCISRDAVSTPPRAGTIGLGVSFSARKGQRIGL